MKILVNHSIQQFNKKDVTAFHFIFHRFYPEIFLFSLRMTGNRQEAEDITLVAFHKLFERCGSFTASVKIKAFLYIAARNSCLNYLEKQKRLHLIKKQLAFRMVQDFLSGPAAELPETLLRSVHTAVDRLPTECRKILKLMYFDALKPKEVAALLGISIHTVYNQHQNGLKALRMVFTFAIFETH